MFVVDLARMGAIPVEEFEQHCINYHQSRDAGFEAEYEVLLCMGPKFISSWVCPF